MLYNVTLTTALLPLRDKNVSNDRDSNQSFTLSSHVPARFTSCHDTLQMNDIGMVELSHNAGLAEEVPPLLLRVAGLQSLYGHEHLPLPRQPQVSAAHLAELSCQGNSEFSLISEKL